MAAVFGFFSGILDEARQLKHDVRVRTGSTRIDARHFRVKLLNPQCHTLYGRVSAEVRGAEGAVERVVFPEYQDLWSKRNIPELPEKLTGGHVNEAEVDLCDCLPEYQSCEGDWEAEALDINPPVSSVGFIVAVSIVVDDLQPGTAIRGVIALSEDSDGSTERRRRARNIDSSPAEDGADLIDMPVARDDTARLDKS